MPDETKWRILLIDDEQDILDVLGMTLLDAGYHVTSATDGEAGLTACAEHPPHIVITDIRMPRMDGIQVLGRLKEDYPNIEVIVATAFGEMELAVKALQLDASDFITKPIAAEALMVAIERAKQRFNTRKKLRDYTSFLEEGLSETTQELLETYTYQQKLIESSMDGILGCNADDLVITFNRSMERMFGHAKKDVLHQKTLADFFAPQAFERFKKDLESGESGVANRLFLYETRMLTSQGDHLPVQLSADVLTDDGRIVGLVCFIRDLRRLRRLEQQMADQAHILHQDKMMSLGRLAASVAHEINNPLSGVLNYIRLMIRISEGKSLTEEQMQKFGTYLTTVEKEVDRCSRIVGNLLTFSRKSEVVTEAVDLRELMQRCLVLSGHRLKLNDIEVSLDIKPPLPTIMGDPNQLQQCLINLIFNAVDAMPDGGRLDLSISGNDTGDSATVTVADTGCGIAAGDMPYIFEPFFTTKHEGQGTGLGLSTTYGIVERHKGTIDVSSQPGKGATFTIKLPAGS